MAEKRERDGGERDRERERGGRGERERFMNVHACVLNHI